MIRFSSVALGLLLSLCSTSSIAHSEHDKARFVAPDGKDIGTCDNALRPCQTIGYAAMQANKGDKVLVASGSYHLDQTADMFYLQSKIIPIRGGYNRFDHYQTQSPANNVSTLIGVPAELAATLEKNGFNVITDLKALSRNKALQQKLAKYESTFKRQSEVNCVDGEADGYSCDSLDLLSHVPLSELSTNSMAANDIWGHVDLNTGKEYAIIGLQRGTSVVDVSNPTAPKEVGAIEGISAIWRDIKVYQYFDKSINVWQAYAYVTLDGSTPLNSDFVTIIDLNNLPHSINVAEQNQVVHKAHNVYVSNVDYALNIAHPNTTPMLHLVGSEKHTGQFLNLDLSNPRTLTQFTQSHSGNVSVGARPYTHDGASMTITDSRKDTDCNSALAHCTVFFDFNESEILLWDITNETNVKALGRGTYSGTGYVHSGWSSDDNQYLFVHDELDERNFGHNTRLRIFDISSLTNPVLAGTWNGPTRATDHNGFVKGNRYYMSNYERGLTVLDITNPTTPTVAGYFDTFIPSDNTSFDGAWGTYPFLPSGNILVSDTNGGLFVLKDNTRASTQGELAFDSKTQTTQPNTQITITVERRNGQATNQAVSVNYAILSGSAELDEDFTGTNGTLNWAANDTTAKTINLDIASNPDALELTEEFFVRLYNPSNGAVLGDNSYITVEIDGAVDKGAGSFTQAQITTAETTNVTVNVSRIGSSIGELSFNYETVNGTAEAGQDFETVSGQITWADGENDSKQITVNVLDDNIEESSETFSIALSSIDNARLGTNPSIEITIADDDNNTPPTVVLPENFQTNTRQTTTLVATVSDADGDSMTYLWQQTGGPSVEISNPDQLTANFTAPNTAATLNFSFTATDFRGGVTTENLTVTVVEPEVITVTPNSSSGGGGSTFWLSLLVLPFVLVRRIIQARG